LLETDNLKMKRFYIAVALFAGFTACKNDTTKETKNDTTKVVNAKPVPGEAIQIDPTKRYIFLTWDDSPQPPGTVISKKIFLEENVKATFFAVGFNQVGPFKKRIIDSLRSGYPQFLLANHSYSHGFNDKYSKFYSAASADSAYNDFIRNEKDLNIGVKIIRLPGNNTWASNGKISGQKSDNPLIKRLDSTGYKIVGWDMEWTQAPGKKQPKESVEQMLAKLNQKLDEGSTNESNMIVILSHDRIFEKTQYADSLRKFIQVLKKDSRNVFETIDHYPGMQNKK
jgi:peptidoglycan-N-acetylglucosamine deacetylase